MDTSLNPLYTGRLKLVPIREELAGPICDAVMENFELFHQWLTFARTIPTLEETQTAMRELEAKNIAGNGLETALFLNDLEKPEDQDLMGMVGIRSIDPVKEPHLVFPGEASPALEIGYWLRAKYQGHGYVTEAVNALTNYAFEKLNVSSVLIVTDVKNMASRAVANRCGFKIVRLYSRIQPLRPDWGMRHSVVHMRLK